MGLDLRIQRLWRPLPSIVLAASVAGSSCVMAVRAVPARTGDVYGELRLVERPGPTLDLRPVVVMLDPADPTAPPAPPVRTRFVRSDSDEFAPDFAPVGPGDTLVFVNHGTLRHRVFTAGVEGDLARDVLPASSSTPLVLPRYGPVRFFCSLHPDEAFLIFVSATPYYTLLAPTGEYQIPGLPVGRYRLSIWSPRVTGSVRDFQVIAGRSVREPIWIDPVLLSR